MTTDEVVANLREMLLCGPSDGWQEIVEQAANEIVVMRSAIRDQNYEHSQEDLQPPQRRQLVDDIVAFRDERGWAKYHTPRNLAEAISVEAGELLQCFLWDGAFPRGNAEDELADVLIYALNLCRTLHVDPEVLVRRKMAKNAEKYPATEPLLRMDAV